MITSAMILGKHAAGDGIVPVKLLSHQAMERRRHHRRVVHGNVMCNDDMNRGVQPRFLIDRQLREAKIGEDIGLTSCCASILVLSEAPLDMLQCVAWLWHLAIELDAR